MTESKYSSCIDLETGWLTREGVAQFPVEVRALRSQTDAYAEQGLVNVFIIKEPLPYDEMVRLGHTMDAGAESAWREYVERHGGLLIETEQGAGVV